MASTRRLFALLSVMLVSTAVSRTARAEATCYQQPFSKVNNPWGPNHRGTDYPQPSGTAIPAVADGVVKLHATSSGLGYVVVIQHADGMFSGYCHMQIASPVPDGTHVKMGQTIGKVGATGSFATGPHLHLTISDHASGWGSGTTVDPYKYIENHKTCSPAPGAGGASGAGGTAGVGGASAGTAGASGVGGASAGTAGASGGVAGIGGHAGVAGSSGAAAKSGQAGAGTAGHGGASGSGGDGNGGAGNGGYEPLEFGDQTDDEGDAGGCSVHPLTSTGLPALAGVAVLLASASRRRRRAR